MATRRYGPYSFDASREDKVLFPDARITKGGLIDFCEKIAETVLPHIKGRPLTMHRFPDGIDSGGFYEKRAPDHFPQWISRVTVDTEDGRQKQVLCDKRATLAYLANQACITPHVWLSRADDLGKPDLVVFDLDPPDGGFGAVRDAAKRFEELFARMNVAAFVKTTGSRGVHLVVPLKPHDSFDDVRVFARRRADHLADRHSDALTTEVRKNKRNGRVFLDTSRNAYGQTVVAPYAVRPTAGAPVATPITWDELRAGDVTSQSYNVSNIFRRLGQIGDLWSDIRRHRRSLKSLNKSLDRAT